jgi:hypothetical protein
MLNVIAIIIHDERSSYTNGNEMMDIQGYENGHGWAGNWENKWCEGGWWEITPAAVD